MWNLPAESFKEPVALQDFDAPGILKTTFFLAEEHSIWFLYMYIYAKLLRTEIKKYIFSHRCTCLHLVDVGEISEK